MRLNSLFKTAAFRLALSFASLFAVSSAALFGSVYWAIQQFESQQIRKSIATEMASLQLSAKSPRSDAIDRELDERLTEPGQHTFQYALFDAAGQQIAGDLSSFRPVLGWQRTEQPASPLPGSEKDGQLYILGADLGNGERLYVAESSQAIEELRETVTSTLALGSSVTVFLAVLGGLAVSGIFMRRIERINRAARSVMDGAIDRRMPVSRRHDEFDQLSVNLNKMLDRIELLVGNLQRVSSDIAHDLRTPLTHLRNGLEQAKVSARTAPEFEAAMDRSIAETDEILRTFGALLRIAEIEAGEQKANFTDVDVSALVGRLCETYGPVAEDEGYTLSCRVAPGILVRGDKAMLTQMIANLSENAIRHTPGGTHIELTLAADRQWITCSVGDSGPGVPAAERDRIFRPFYRLDPSRSGPGSGLGLALVRAIAELHGGSVAVLDNAPGALFVVRLPVPTAQISGQRSSEQVTAPSPTHLLQSN